MLSQDAVDELFDAAGAVDDAAGKGGPEKEVHLYDFRHPHRISKERLRTIDAMYDRMVRSLEGWLMGRVRGSVEFRVESVEQLSFSEFTLALPTPCSSFVFDVRDSGGQQVVIDMGRELAAVLVDRFFGGSGAPIIPERGLTPIERMAVATLAERVAKLLSEVWNEYVSLDLSLNSFEAIPEIIRAANGDDPVLVATIHAEVAGVVSRFMISLPLSAIDGFLLEGGVRRLESTTGSEEDRRRNRVQAEQLVRQAKIAVSVRLPQFRITMGDLAAAQVGTTLDTGIRGTAQLEVHLRDQVRFIGAPGRAGSKLAVTISDGMEPGRHSTGR